MVAQPGYAGMRDDLYEALPNALQILIHPDHADTGATAGISVDRPVKRLRSCSPTTAIASASATTGITALFNQLHDDLTRSTTRP